MPRSEYYRDQESSPLSDATPSPLAAEAIRPLKRRDLSISIVLGIVFFLLSTGGRILWPSNIDWLMTGEDDGGTHYLGWEFYRNAPLLQWPFGANPDYGMEISSSIVFSDSIPLFAMALKPFSPLLPRPFQYLGIWLLVCFILQAFFAARLLRVCGVADWRVWLGVAFFVNAPAFLFRISVSHYAGSAHWIVLAALVMYFQSQRQSWGWTILLCVASLVNIYLAVMAGAIYAADLIQRLWMRESRFAQTLRHGVITGGLLLFTMYAAGYFMAGKYTADQGFGYYRLNLLAPILPMGAWSRWLPSPKVGAGDFEGFHYLGLGVLAMLIVAAACGIRSFWRLKSNGKPLVPRKQSLQSTRGEAGSNEYVSAVPGTGSLTKARWIPIAVVLIGCTVFGLSNRIAAGSVELFAFDLPPKLWPVCSSFRSSGRFFLPVYYVIIAIGCGVLLRSFRSKLGVLIPVALLGLQWADISQNVDQLRHKLSHAKPWESPLKSDFWTKAGKHYKSLVVMSPAKHYDGYLPLAHFAVAHGMSTNAVYLARVDQEKLLKSTESLRSVSSLSQYSPKSLYVLEGENLSNEAPPASIVLCLDGFRIVAP